jgi:predicted aldo/keto reductase-like oxidoreductase
MNTNSSRRDFLKTLAIAGAGALISGSPSLAAPGTPPTAKSGLKVPKRPFGKTGIEVSILGMGTMYDILNNQINLKQSLDRGVTYWDTADCYEGGRAEKGVGKFFACHPEARKEIFLVTKSDDRDPSGMSSLLARSMERMRTDVIDLYFVHGIGNINEMDDNVKAWAHRMKKEGKIKFIGFSTHKNMESCLMGASKLGWIDGIMFSYNFRLMNKDAMRAAVDACVAAGIGLTAMKTQGGGSVRIESESEINMASTFLDKGFSDAQAKLKAVWEDARISCICSQMPTVSILTANIAAALDRTQLDAKDWNALEQYAEETRCGYCAGCGNICGMAANGEPISDVMRHLMYYHSYGNHDLARSQFAGLPEDFRARMSALDYSAAERACPHGLPIAQLMKEAGERLA